MMLHWKAKAVYWGVLAATAAAWCGTLTVLTWPEPGQAWSPILYISALSSGVIGGSLLAGWVCRGLRLSLALKSTDVVAAGEATHARTADIPGVPLRTLGWRLGAVWAAALGLGGLVGILNAGRPDKAGVMALLALLFVGLKGSSWVARSAPPRVRVDGAGITETTAFGRDYPRIAWSQVARCELRTERDAVDRVTSAILDVFDAAGNKLTYIDLTHVPEDARRQLLDAIRGGPAPTELMAAEAPAGRGTELTSEPGLGSPLARVRAGEVLLSQQDALVGPGTSVAAGQPDRMRT